MARQSKGLDYVTTLRMTMDEKQFVDMVRAEYDNTISMNDALRVAIMRGATRVMRRRPASDLWVLDPDAARAEAQQQALAERQAEQQARKDTDS